MALIGYARVSTAEQNPDAQRDALAAAGADRVFEDLGVSGRLASRPGLDAALAFLRDGDTLVVLRLDCEQPRSVSSFSLRSVSGQVVPMTRVLRAASTTSLVMTSSSLIFRTRWI